MEKKSINKQSQLSVKEILNKLNCKLNDTIKLSDLTLEKEYIIINYKTVNTRHGDTIVITLRDDEKEIDVFLPNRYTKCFECISSSNILGKLSMIYHGMNEKANVKSGKFHVIEFKF